jgi:hypothetical protein
LEGLSYKQIADVTEIPVGTVMSRLARGRKRLEQNLSQMVRQESAQTKSSDPKPPSYTSVVEEPSETVMGRDKSAKTRVMAAHQQQHEERCDPAPR